MQYREEYPDPEPVETSEKMEGPQVPTLLILIFCTKKKKKSISWCKNKFASKEKLEWFDLALAEEANYLVILFDFFRYICDCTDNYFAFDFQAEFEKFKVENPLLKPKLIPVLNQEEKLLVFITLVLKSSNFKMISTGEMQSQLNHLLQASLCFLWNTAPSFPQMKMGIKQERFVGTLKLECLE